MAVGDRDGADKPRRAFRSANLAKRVVDEVKLLRVAAVHTTEAGRLDAGRAVHRIDFEARVVRDTVTEDGQVVEDTGSTVNGLLP